MKKKDPDIPIPASSPEDPPKVPSQPEISEHLAAELGGLEAILSARLPPPPPPDKKKPPPQEDES